MKVHELINSIAVEKLQKHMNTVYNKKGINLYLEIFNKLKNMEPMTSKELGEIVLFEGYDFGNDRTHIIEEIVRKKELENIPDSYEELELSISRYSLCFSPWNECLSCIINKQTLQDFSPEDIVCFIMEELTEFGPNEETITNEQEKIETSLKESEKDVAEGKTYSLEDLGYVDTRTPEEKEESIRNITEGVKNNLKKYYEYIKI